MSQQLLDSRRAFNYLPKHITIPLLRFIVVSRSRARRHLTLLAGGSPGATQLAEFNNSLHHTHGIGGERGRPWVPFFRLLLMTQMRVCARHTRGTPVVAVTGDIGSEYVLPPAWVDALGKQPTLGKFNGTMAGAIEVV